MRWPTFCAEASLAPRVQPPFHPALCSGGLLSCADSTSNPLSWGFCAVQPVGTCGSWAGVWQACSCQTACLLCPTSKGSPSCPCSKALHSGSIYGSVIFIT